ncbi:limbic system-associated membrane protein-like isoform X1 [Rhipicephalus microplus]|uniref:limbic system-associated membrane protein-like isoform X1 n=1 Tax=Rhipicephalus microplus TaxID=6941 RepID=UPI003F6BE3BC
MRRVGNCVCYGSTVVFLLLGILLGLSSAQAQEDETEVPQDRKVEFLTKEQTFFLSLGDSVTLPCKIVQSSEDEFIKVWIKNKDILFAGSFRVDTDPRISLGPEGELKIDGLVASDDAVYTCKVNSQIEPNSIQHKIVLPGPPRLSTIPESGEVTVMKGEPLYIGCVASGKPDSTITWRHMDHISTSNVARSSRSNDSSIDVNKLVKDNRIDIEAADSKHSGTYQCTASNGYGNPVTDYITVKVLGKPTVKTSLLWSSGVGGSLNAELLCVTHSDVPGTTRWLRTDGTWLMHGESVSLYTSGNHYTARFKHVTERDYGNYTCESKNKFGVTSDTVELQAAPTRPVVMAVEGPNSTAYLISLSSVAPYPISKYMIYIRAEKHAQDVEEWRNITIPRSHGHDMQKMGSKAATSYLITNLEPETRYQAYAVAINEMGTSGLTSFDFMTAFALPKQPLSTKASEEVETGLQANDPDALQEQIKDSGNGNAGTRATIFSPHMVGCVTVALLSIFFC